ncbi:helix-turn-helix domain-containing protein [Brucella pseudogrignonensis]|uniref:Plasmid maintenance system antidote protein VapI n=1 Tax=Brucella pseudogrignonensis TaxID=419475 RepID=A0ABU1M7J0_9HYPH|nr:helix-turn-helix domain-containing protein [Brucella pseudogrignonensis]MDR6431995.1 plasmid maintenance system antidote protein VapI [Brucella pseudogrignonensis]
MFAEWVASNLDKKAGKTQKGLAEALGVAHPQITHLVKGTRDIKVREVPIIAKYLGVAPPSWPVDITPNVDPEAEIFRLLQQAEGLDKRAVELASLAIEAAFQAKKKKSSELASDDQSLPANPHHEPTP